jgi:drug/metabolite transporter (DMT)-like permease
LVLASAVLHAAWNAIIKAAPHSSDAMAAMVMIAGVPCGLSLLVSGPPPLAATPWLALAVTGNVTAALLMGHAYNTGDLAVVYPLMRGLTPLLITFMTAAVFGERPTPTGIGGIMLVSVGIVLLAWEAARRSPATSGRSLLLTAAAAAVTALYIVLDAAGARLSQNAFAYAGAAGLGNALVVGVLERVRGTSPFMLVRKAGAGVIAPALLSFVAYFLFIFALTEAPAASVATLRETSVVFAVLIAAFLLGERVSSQRWVAIMLVFFGASLLR